MRLTGVAKRLRRDSTKEERILWSRLRDHRMAGAKFRRQRPVGRYVVDFICVEERLVIELDGSQHGKAKNLKNDRARDASLKALGYKVLRFSNNDVNHNLDDVLLTIWKTIES